MEPAENQGQPPSEPGSNGSNGNGANHEEPLPSIETASSLVETLALPAKPETKRLETDWPENDGLSQLERNVLLAYIETRNITEAGRRAGLRHPYEYAKRVLENERVQKVLKGRLRANHITIDHVLGELSDLAYTDMGDFLNDDGTPNLKAIKSKGKFIKTYTCKLLSTETDEGVKREVFGIKLELHDRHAALVDVGKTFRMFGHEQGTGEGGQTAQTIINLVVLAAEQELPKELAGRLLIALGEKMKTVKG